MNSLDIFSIRALMQALEQVHSTTDAAALPERLFSALLALIPGAFFTLDELDLKTGQVTELTSVEGRIPDDIRKRILELVPTHPIMPVYKAGRRGTASHSVSFDRRRTMSKRCGQSISTIK